MDSLFSPWPFDPVMFEIGPIKAHWYGFMYAVSFIVGYCYLQYSAIGKRFPLTSEQKDLLVMCIIAGVLLGGRLGYIIFYNLHFYLSEPLKIFAVWEGGMSFHGGVIGVLIALILFLRKYKVSFWPIADALASIAPLGVMLVRIGNFINAELYGRVAENFCIYFPTDPQNCRYPSQLLQALLEGLLLLIILQIVIRKTSKPGVVTMLFLLLYGVFRIIAEFFREPDVQIGFLPGGITQGQLLSIVMIIAAGIVWLKQRQTWKSKP